MTPTIHCVLSFYILVTMLHAVTMSLCHPTRGASTSGGCTTTRSEHTFCQISSPRSCTGMDIGRTCSLIRKISSIPLASQVAHAMTTRIQVWGLLGRRQMRNPRWLHQCQWCLTASHVGLKYVTQRGHNLQRRDSVVHTVTSLAAQTLHKQHRANPKSTAA